ncbi:MAG: TerB family tellurite resistance protein, partial [Gemmatimonadota bacterium]
GDRGRFVECQNCNSTFPPAVLKVADASADADYLKGIRRVAIQMMARDLDDASIRREAERVSERSDEDLTEFLSSLAANMNDSGKELILKTAFWVVGADAKFEEEEASFIYRIGGALGVSAADVRVLMDRMA